MDELIESNKMDRARMIKLKWMSWLNWMDHTQIIELKWWVDRVEWNESFSSDSIEVDELIQFNEMNRAQVIQLKFKVDELIQSNEMDRGRMIELKWMSWLNWIEWIIHKSLSWSGELIELNEMKWNKSCSSDSIEVDELVESNEMNRAQVI